jgi:hypothetical protein
MKLNANNVFAAYEQIRGWRRSGTPATEQDLARASAYRRSLALALVTRMQ